MLRRLTAGRWLVPLMAHLDEADGSRFAVMLHRLGVSRSVLTASLAQLAEAGWITRNPGHGHPLRPEYILTEAGAPVAAFCRRLMEQRARLGLGAGDLARWSLPVIARRKGDEWFVGSITNNDAREIKLPLSFLPKDKRFVATVYADDASVPTRTKVGVRTLAAGADDVWTLNLPASGGQAIWLRPER